MAIKKSELYSSIWASCDELRGGMDASQYKDYVLFMLFIKYISDKYSDSKDFAPPVTIPAGASFKDMVRLKGKSDIGDKINTQIIQPLIDNNTGLARSDFPDFNDPNKLGEGKAMVDRLSNLISIFEKPELDFSKNRAEHDDILGDAYEYLMRHFAQDSGKSKGQFYTPSEVSRVIAKVIGISPQNTVASTTAYDPTCGSGSLLLKVAAEAGKRITLEGQEKDVTTAGLARMNMILHDFPTAKILNGNTLAAPKFLDGSRLRTYDYVVANPPFSDKTWSTGLTPSNDMYQRFEWGEPPAKQGDYAYLLHIIRSMNNTKGKAACILPHGVLFRGNAEVTIRKELILSGYLKGIIGLPANLFYGTGIPACILVLDKENAPGRKGIFMIDASKEFMKDGNKNRLRERDIHKIVDTFKYEKEIPRYSRIVPFAEITDPKHNFNLNLPRYINSSEPEDLQDIDAHLRGGIPERDIEALETYWQELPSLRKSLFENAGRPGYVNLALSSSKIRAAIMEHAEFAAFKQTVANAFEGWRSTEQPYLKSFEKEGHPKALIERIAENLLTAFSTIPLLDAYAVYQHLMDYWSETMQDDCYLIAADGWKAEPHRVLEEVKSGKNKGEMKDKGWACDLIPKPYIVARYFQSDQDKLDALQAETDAIAAKLEELREENSGEEGILNDVYSEKDAKEAYLQALVAVWLEDDKAGCSTYTALVEQANELDIQIRALTDTAYISTLKDKKGKLAAKDVSARLTVATDAKEKAVLKSYTEAVKNQKSAKQTSAQLIAKAAKIYLERIDREELPDDLADLRATVRFLELLEEQKEAKNKFKAADAALDAKAHDKYATLTVAEIKTLVVDDKWFPSLQTAIHGELERVSQALATRIRELAERYATPLPQLANEVDVLTARVKAHLKKMGAVWD